MPDITIMVKEFPMIFSASSILPLPLSIEQSGAPPIPKRLANAITIVMIGSERPIPVSDRVESCGILPMYILSTML